MISQNHIEKIYESHLIKSDDYLFKISDPPVPLCMYYLRCKIVLSCK